MESRRDEGFTSYTYALFKVKEVMSVEDYSIRSDEGAATGPVGGRRLRASLPDGVWCDVPGEWPLREDARFSFGCDFRPVGGPERVVTLEYGGAALVRWVCEDRA